jgi:dihydrofolate synthase/folylpolyglutamate synthase
MRFSNETEAITYVFESIAHSNWRHRGLDEDTRDTTPTKHLLARLGLPVREWEYVVVTGSKGKGSVSAITAKLLQHLGHTVGLLTSPHLSTYRQRFRINGRMISESELVRLVNEVAPDIDAVEAALEPGKYLSPQGIFLAMALKWFDENQVTAAVIEVGRGGRFDDNALVDNKLSLFTPIILEHARYMGNSVDRIAWHKAGIIKPGTDAYSLPQSDVVRAVLQEEADQQQARLEFITQEDMGRYLGPTDSGMRVDFGPYGVVDFPMLGRYEISNASLALRAVRNMHRRLASDIAVDSPEYVEGIRAGLQSVFWPGRCQKLQDHPTVYVDGAHNTTSAPLFIESVRERLTPPVVTVLAVPTDRDYKAVYPMYAEISDALVITQSARNITISFPDEATALPVARQFHSDVTYRHDIGEAIQFAIQKAGPEGTVLLAVAQPAIGDTMVVYGLEFEQI